MKDKIECIVQRGIIQGKPHKGRGHGDDSLDGLFERALKPDDVQQFDIEIVGFQIREEIQQVQRRLEAQIILAYGVFEKPGTGTPIRVFRKLRSICSVFDVFGLSSRYPMRQSSHGCQAQGC